MNLAEFSIKRRTTTLVLIAVALVGGIVSFNSLGRLEDPEFTIKDAVVMTQYPGASPREVEEEVTERIEEAIQAMGQLKEVRSISRPGLSIVYATMQEQYDKTTLPQVWDELRRKVGDVQSQLPPGVLPSVVNDDFGDTYWGVSGSHRRGLFLCGTVGYRKVPEEGAASGDRCVQGGFLGAAS